MADPTTATTTSMTTTAMTSTTAPVESIASSSFTPELLARIKTIRERLYSLRKIKADSKSTREMNRLWAEVEGIVRTLVSARNRSVRNPSSQAATDDSAAVASSGAAAAAAAAADEEEEEMGLLDQAEVVLDDLVPMFVQFWSANGKLSEQMYPVYVKLAKASHVLESLNESGMYKESDLAGFESELRNLGEKVRGFAVVAERNASSVSVSVSASPSSSSTDHPTAPPPQQQQQQQQQRLSTRGLKILRAKHEACRRTLAQMRTQLATIAPALLPVHARLVEIKAELASLLARSGGGGGAESSSSSRPTTTSFSLAEVQILQDELRDIDSARIDGSYLAAADGSVLPGQAAVISLLESSYEDVHELLSMREAIDGDNPLRPLYERLIVIKGRLEKALIVSLRNFNGDDLVPLQMELGEIDNARVDGIFFDPRGDGRSVPEGQAVMHFLLHKCYRMVRKIQMAAEENSVHDSLANVRSQLTTLIKCLSELHRWKVRLSSHDLIFYQVKLAALDNLRVDGKYLDGEGNVPEGQGILHQMLHDAYEMLSELQADEDDDDIDDDDDCGDYDDDDDDEDEDDDEGLRLERERSARFEIR